MEIPKSLAAKLNQGRQYRAVVQIEARAAAEDAPDEMIVEGYASTFNEPYELWRYGNYTFLEQVDPHAFDEADMNDVIMQYNHEGRVFARVSNKTLELKIDDHGLHIRADLGGTETGRQLYEEIKGGYTTKMSFGFVIDEDNRLVTEDHENNTVTVLRTITKIRKVYDVSAVSLPANDETEISARSYCDGVIAELTEESRKRDDERRAKQIRRIRIMTNL